MQLGPLLGHLRLTSVALALVACDHDEAPKKSAGPTVSQAEETARGERWHGVVKVRVRVTPPGARVVVGGQALPASGEIEMPQRDVPAEVVAVAPGYMEQRITFTPKTDQSFDLTLPLIPGGPRTGLPLRVESANQTPVDKRRPGHRPPVPRPAAADEDPHQ